MWNLVGAIVFQILGVFVFGGALIGSEKGQFTKKVSKRGVVWGFLFIIAACYLFVQYGKTLGN